MKQEDRLQQLEEKMDLMLDGSMCGPVSFLSIAPHEANGDRLQQSGTTRTSETLRSYLRDGNNEETTLESTDLPHASAHRKTRDETASQVVNDSMFAIPPKYIVTESISLYFQYCHKQPLWLFDPDGLSMPEGCRNEVIFGILALALRYSNNDFLHGRTDQLCRRYAEAACSLVMLRITQGTVDLSTMQSLCLIALAEYISKWLLTHMTK